MIHSCKKDRVTRPFFHSFWEMTELTLQLWANVPARTPDIEPWWLQASRISPLTMTADNYCHTCVCVCMQEDGEFVLEGLLNIYWGLCRPIRLQMYDDNERFRFSRYNGLIQMPASNFSPFQALWSQKPMICFWREWLAVSSILRIIKTIILALS